MMVGGQHKTIQPLMRLKRLLQVDSKAAKSVSGAIQTVLSKDPARSA